MRFLFVVSFLTICLSIQAQNFTGKIVFTVSVEGENAELNEMFMPKALEYSFGKSKMGLAITGGIVEKLFGNLLIDNKTEQVYIISHEDQSVAEYINDLPKSDEKITVTKEADVDNILGYSCQKYKGVSVIQDTQITRYWWVTDKLKLQKAAARFDMIGLGVFNLPDVSGLVLRMVLESEGSVIKVEATEFSDESVRESEFSFPKNYSRLVKKASDKE
jgi:hypothetical protein